MPYIGRDLNRGNYLKLDDISSSFNSSTTTFNLTVGGSAFTPGSAFAILVSVGGVIQEPESAYQVNNSEITFANAPTAQDSFFCIALGVALGIGVPGNGTVNGTQMAKPFNYDGYFYLDDANNRVGIGSLAPTVALDVDGVIKASSFTGGSGGINAGVVTCTGLDLNGNGDISGNLVLGGDLTVNGTTTTLDTNLIGVDRVEVGANSSTVVGVAVTQSGTADLVRLYDGSTQVVTIDDTGLVSIGKTSNAGKGLEVYQAGDAAIRIQNNASGTGNNDGILLEIGNTSKDALIYNYETANMLFGTAGTERVRITSTGNVEIDSFNSPSTRTLSLRTGYLANANGGVGLAAKDHSGAAADGLGVYGTDGVSIHTANAGTVYERLRITTDGNVGIGTNDPNTELEVFSDTFCDITINSARTSGNIGGLNFRKGGVAAGIMTAQYFVNASGSHFFHSQGQERFRIDSSGLIQTKTRSAEVRRLILSGSPTNTAFNIEAHDGATGTNAGTIQGELGLYYNDGSTLSDTATIKFERGSGAPDGAMTLFTNNTERVRITSDGDINIHNRTAASTTDPVTVDFGGQYTPDASITHQNLKVKLFSNSSNNDAAGLTMAQSGNAYVSSVGAGHLFYTAPSAVDTLIERLRITHNGKVNIGTGNLNQTDRMLNVYGGRMRIEGISSGNSFEIINSASAGSSFGMLIQAGANSSDINSTFRNTSGSTLFRIRGDGHIGIGEDSPDVDLHIKNTNPAIYLEGTNGSGRQHKIWSAGGNSQALQFTSGELYYNADTHVFRATNESTRYGLIDSSGRFLLGTNTSTRETRAGVSPYHAQLQLESDVEAAVSVTRFGGAHASRLNLQHARGTIASIAAAQNNDDLGQISFSGWDGDTFTNGAEIRAQVDGAPGDDDMPGRLLFSTTPDGGTTPFERLRITSGGNIGINSTSPNAQFVLSRDLNTNHGIEMGYSSSGSGLHFIQAYNRATSAWTLLKLNNSLSITSTGKVLIGSSTHNTTIGSGVGSQLQIEGNTYQTSSLALINNQSSGDPAFLVFGKSRAGSNGGTTIVQNGDNLGGIRWSGADGSDLHSRAAQIEVFVDGAPGGNDMPGRVVISTTPDNSPTPVEHEILYGSTKEIRNAGYYVAQTSGSGTSANTASFGATQSGMNADTYNFILSGSNDVGNKCTMFVNGSNRSADGGTNNLTFRNDGGELILGSTSYLTHLPGLTEGTIRARTLVTSYQDSITNTGGCLTGGANDKDAWIFNWYDSASWGIYSRNIDSTLTVNGFGLPANSTAFIGAGALKAYIDHNDGTICGSGGFKIDGENTATNQAKGITWTAYDKENTNDRSDVAGIIHTINQEGLAGAVLRIYSDNDDNDGIVLKGGANTGSYGTRVVNGLQIRSGGLRPTAGTGENGIMWPTDPYSGSGDKAHIQYHQDGSGENTQLRIQCENDGDDDILITANGGVAVTGTFTKPGGSFRIPHVLAGLTTTTDLVHSFIEGPQADNLYRGRTTLVAGISTVNIDTTNNMTEGTFVNLNRDVQCFTSNETGWTAVKGSVTGNLLTIVAQDNTCTDTISWMVVGERWDLHMYDPHNPMTDENGKVRTEVPNKNYNRGGGFKENYIIENKLRVGISTISRPSIENKEVE